MSAIRQVHWGRIVVAGFLSEVAVFAIFLLLVIAATLAGVPDVARPMSTLDYIDAILSSFAMVFLFTLWLGKRIESGFMLHGALVGVVGFCSQLCGSPPRDHWRSPLCTSLLIF
jgi:hypothetical protein